MLCSGKNLAIAIQPHPLLMPLIQRKFSFKKSRRERAKDRTQNRRLWHTIDLTGVTPTRIQGVENNARKPIFAAQSMPKKIDLIHKFRLTEIRSLFNILADPHYKRVDKSCLKAEARLAEAMIKSMIDSKCLQSKSNTE